MPSTAKHGTTRGLPIKEVLEHLLPELDISCLRLAFNTPKVTEQLMKLDEQGVRTVGPKANDHASSLVIFASVLPDTLILFLRSIIHLVLTFLNFLDFFSSSLA